jgi:hypothetical protein
VVALEWRAGSAAILRTVKLEERAKTPLPAGAVVATTARLASRFATSVLHDRRLIDAPTQGRRRGTVLNNAAALKGEPLPYLLNPVFPVVIHSD